MKRKMQSGIVIAVLCGLLIVGLVVLNHKDSFPDQVHMRSVVAGAYADAEGNIYVLNEKYFLKADLNTILDENRFSQYNCQELSKLTFGDWLKQNELSTEKTEIQYDHKKGTVKDSATGEEIFHYQDGTLYHESNGELHRISDIMTLAEELFEKNWRDDFETMISEMIASHPRTVKLKSSATRVRNGVNLCKCSKCGISYDEDAADPDMLTVENIKEKAGIDLKNLEPVSGQDGCYRGKTGTGDLGIECDIKFPDSPKKVRLSGVISRQGGYISSGISRVIFTT